MALIIDPPHATPTPTTIPSSTTKKTKKKKKSMFIFICNSYLYFYFWFLIDSFYIFNVFRHSRIQTTNRDDPRKTHLKWEGHGQGQGMGMARKIKRRVCVSLYIFLSFFASRNLSFFTSLNLSIFYSNLCFVSSTCQWNWSRCSDTHYKYSGDGAHTV